MQRGVLKLSDQELDICIQQLASSSQNVKFLKEKLLHAREAKSSNTTVELSEDEVDILLDVLPAPQGNEIKELSNLRKNLKEFLMTLRNSQTSNKTSFWKKLNPLNWSK